MNDLLYDTGKSCDTIVNIIDVYYVGCLFVTHSTTVKNFAGFITFFFVCEFCFPAKFFCLFHTPIWKTLQIFQKEKNRKTSDSLHPLTFCSWRPIITATLNPYKKTHRKNLSKYQWIHKKSVLCISPTLRFHNVSVIN